MPWVLVCQGLAGRVVSSEGREPPIGAFLKDFDVEAHDGRGTCTWGTEAEAMRFASVVEALEAWRTQSRSRPLRPDGQPNRPLTAFTVEPRRVS